LAEAPTAGESYEISVISRRPARWVYPNDGDILTSKHGLASPARAGRVAEGEEIREIVLALPPSMRVRYKPKRFAPGCYLVGPAVFSFVWIASNELPLRDDLVPFLLTRSGKAMDEFVTWATPRLSPQRLLDMVECVAMSDFARNYVRHYVEDNSPEQLERERWLAAQILERHPEFAQPVEDKGRLAGERRALRRILVRRGLLVSPADDARIDACADITTLERWIDEAAVAKTAAEVFGEPAKKPRAAPKRKAR
jgi:hypothetical protein